MKAVLVAYSLLITSSFAHAAPQPEVSTPVAVQPSTPPERPAFADVQSTHWAYAAVEKLAALGIIEGYPANAKPAPVALASASVLSSLLMPTSKPAPAIVMTPIVKTALGEQKALNSSNIDVNTDGNRRMVTLKGTVQNAAHERLAIAVARKYASGFRVDNRLHVVGTKSVTTR